MKFFERLKVKLSKADFRDCLKRMLLMLIANVGYSATLHLFLAGNNIAGGGLPGLGVIVTNFIDLPIGVFVLLCNVPIFLWAVFVKDRTYLITTLIATLVYAAMIDLFAFLPTVTDNLLIASICGGVSYGVFIAVMARADCSTGGTDLLIKLLVTKFKGVSLGAMYMIVDGLVVLAAMVLLKSFELGLYAAIVIVVYSWVSDQIIRGFNRASIFYIITDHPAPIAKAILQEMNRGVTQLHGTGMYAMAEKGVLMTVVRPREVYKLKDILKRLDPGAFAVLTSANEVMGQGFAKIDYTQSKQDGNRDKEALKRNLSA